MSTVYFCVSLGAVLGACARFFCTHLSSELSEHHGFPYGTLFVNVLGSLIAGFFLIWAQASTETRWKLLVVTGFCGSFTTFSTFAYETYAYMKAADYRTGLVNFALNNVLCLGAVVLGAVIAREAHRA